VIEGHKAAGSYDKMMVTDFAASICRRKQRGQTLTGAGRLAYYEEYRYGMDGLTL
jgi:hypothetical protein